MENYQDLFDQLDNKLDFLTERKGGSTNGIYKVDPKKAKDKTVGYKAVIRFLPNLRMDGTLGESAIEKLSHFVNIKGAEDLGLNGYYDSPKNFDKSPSNPCPLTKLSFKLKESQNALLAAKARSISYERKYFSYVLVLEDEQQPELVGKIMVFKFGQKIKDKIALENSGEITGVRCNVYSPDDGKDFVLKASETKNEKGDLVTTYDLSAFRPSSPVTIFKTNAEGKLVGKKLTVTDGKLEPKHLEAFVEFMKSREVNIEDHAPKPLTEEQHEKIRRISAYLLGDAMPQPVGSVPSSADFSTDDDFLGATTTSSSSTLEDDDFFNN
jgi:hypothetical protein